MQLTNQNVLQTGYIISKPQVSMRSDMYTGLTHMSNKTRSDQPKNNIRQHAVTTQA